MIKKLFGSIQSFDLSQEKIRKKSAIRILEANDDDKEFKRSIKNTIKSPEDEKKIRAAIESNDFLSNIITEERFLAIFRTIYSQDVKGGETIIQQGEIGGQLFISASGKFEIINKSGNVDYFDDVRVFGELGLLYNEKRKATVRAVTDGKLWVLENKSFKEIAKRTEEEERNERVAFLSKLPKLNKISIDSLNFVADLMTKKFYPPGTEIIKQGDKADAFYMIRAGAVKIRTKTEGTIGRLTKAQYFGEIALLTDQTRKVTVVAESPGCECLVLHRKHFIKHFGIVKDFQKITISGKAREIANFNRDTTYDSLELEDFRKIRTIGTGGFGRVDLIRHKTNAELIFALKYLKKYRCVLPEQREHVLNEKNVQINCYSPFIIRLYKTYKDHKYLYFLMEAQFGGDLWRLLYHKRRRPFAELEAKFYVGCVVEALQYLHEMGVVYRDLKPENLLISSSGYVKLTDFGFAKWIGPEKTHSMVGTPDYMPPEIVMNRSHDRAVDLWTVGIFIYELITLQTPFASQFHHKTYNSILKGIEYCKFSSLVSCKARHLIMKLCKKRPGDRLGYSKNGLIDVKNHAWFADFNWDSFLTLKMKAPYVPQLDDLSNSGVYKDDTSDVPDVESDWDAEF